MPPILKGKDKQRPRGQEGGGRPPLVVSDGIFAHPAEAAGMWTFTPHTKITQPRTKTFFSPNHHQNNNKLLTRTNLKISVSSTSHSAPLLYLSPIPALPSACPHSSFLPGMMETVSFSQDTTLTYSCTEEGMRHLKTATFPRIDL